MQTLILHLPSEILASIARYLCNYNPRFHALLNFALSCRNVHEAVSNILYHSLEVDYLSKPLVKLSSKFSARIASDTRKFVATTTTKNILNYTFPRFHQLNELELRFSYTGDSNIGSENSNYPIEKVISLITFDTLQILSLSIRYFEDFWPVVMSGVLSKLKMLRTFNLMIDELGHNITDDNSGSTLATLSWGISHLVNLRSFKFTVDIMHENISIAPILNELKLCRKLETLSIELCNTCFDSVDPLKSFLSMGAIESVRLSHVPVDVSLIRNITCSSISTLILDNVNLDVESIVALFKSPQKVLRLNLDYSDYDDSIHDKMIAIPPPTIEELIVNALNDTLSELILRQLRNSTHLRILTIDVCTEKGIFYLSEIIQNSSSLTHLACRFCCKTSDDVYETLFASIHSNQLLSSLDFYFETEEETHINSFVNIGPNVTKLAIAFVTCDEFSLYLLISKLRENPSCKLKELNISMLDTCFTKKEVLRIKLDSGSKSLAFGLVSYSSGDDRTLLLDVFRDYGDWNDLFDVVGTYVEELSEDEEWCLLKDLRVGLNREIEVKLHNGRRLVFLR